MKDKRMAVEDVPVFTDITTVKELLKPSDRSRGIIMHACTDTDGSRVLLASFVYAKSKDGDDNHGTLSFTLKRHIQNSLIGESKYEIAIGSTSTNFNGRRHWFICSECGGRSIRLYLPRDESVFACRDCHNLAYASSQSHGNPTYEKLLRPRKAVARAVRLICKKKPTKQEAEKAVKLYNYGQEMINRYLEQHKKDMDDYCTNLEAILSRSGNSSGLP